MTVTIWIIYRAIRAAVNTCNIWLNHQFEFRRTTFQERVLSAIILLVWIAVQFARLHLELFYTILTQFGLILIGASRLYILARWMMALPLFNKFHRLVGLFFNLSGSTNSGCRMLCFLKFQVLGLIRVTVNCLCAVVGFAVLHLLLLYTVSLPLYRSTIRANYQLASSEFLSHGVRRMVS